MTSKQVRLLTATAIAGAATVAGAAGLRAWRQATTDRELLPRGRALITGASSGIGEAFARRLAAEGFDLTLVARREERLRALADALSAAHAVRAEVLAADLGRPEEIARLVEAIQARSDLTLMINNAGFGTHGDFAEVALERHLEMMRVHNEATVALSWAALPGMVARGGGAIINVSSVAAFFPSGGGSIYSATKVFLNNFSEALAAEVSGSGVRVQALCPGFTYSEFHDTAEYEAFDRKTIPDKLWMSAEAVVDESLAALGGDKVIVVPGRVYQGMVLAAQSPLGGTIRSAARTVRRRWHVARDL